MIDINQNKAYYNFFGTKEKSIEALQSLVNCKNCCNCSNLENAYQGHNFDGSLYTDDTKVYHKFEDSDDLWMKDNNDHYYIGSRKQDGFIYSRKIINEIFNNI